MRFLAALFLCLLPQLAAAQERPSAILVLDASGSMWGQIDGKAKITIAQEVIGGLLTDMPGDQALGLTAYGHRRKGDCNDIETLVLPGGDTRAAIANAVNAIQPKGKTPLSAAVIQAAETLKYSEEKATVILVSDGKETCEFDPCEVGKQLEQTGVDFTAHVIGFDIADPADRAELQCLAEETGGTYYSASNAQELGTAIFEVVEVNQPPVAITARVTATAVTSLSNTPITDPITWALTGPNGPVDVSAEQNPFSLDLDLGAYTLTADWLIGEQSQTTAFELFGSADATVQIVFDAPLPKASVTPSENPATAGSMIDILWAGPGAVQDFIGIGPQGATGADRWENFAYTKDGAPAALLMPVTPGAYTLSYFHGPDHLVLATADLTVTPVSASLTAPAEAPAGSQITLDWTGPGYDNDYIGIGPVAAQDSGRWQNYSYTREGSPLPLTLPVEPGAYMIRYFLGQDRAVLAERPITLTAAGASITAPETAPAGSTIQVGWSGPDYEGDYIAIGKPDASGAAQWETYSYTRDGSPLALETPTEPGNYLIRYITGQDRKTLAEAPLVLEPVTASLTAPQTAIGGAVITVEWTGPNYPQDFIAIGKTGAEGSARWAKYTRTEEGSPLTLQLPAAPGDYTLRYFLNADRSVLAEAPITLTQAPATLSAPPRARAGEVTEITWQGPDYPSDYIAIGKAGAEGSARWEKYIRTSSGNPATLPLPETPGTYVIRYFINADRYVIAEIPITLE
ncbi:VWA domain-containing protein [Alphaproteobacteria bacterium KMM 3653]|uniref:VWA domain-containing protein n=1 Tax=Harenicola maris TaxID=2841044 RepID=A0AAP2G729_9RHOB|nr:VWA domain-containing protein [Harenicola maris]